MRLKSKPGNNNGNQGKQHAPNIPLRVTGFKEINGGNEVLIEGKNLIDGQEIAVGLSDTGHDAQNNSRPTLKGMRDSGAIQVGGLLSFRACWKPSSKDHFISNWPNVLGKNAEEVKGKARRGKASILSVEGKNPRVVLRTYVDDPEKHIKGKNGAEVMESVAAAARSAMESNEHARPQFLIRALDNSGVVTQFRLFKHSYNSDEKRMLTGDEIAESLGGVVDYIKDNNPDIAGFNIVPAQELPFTKQGIGDAKSYNHLHRKTLIAFLPEEDRERLKAITAEIDGHYLDDPTYLEAIKEGDWKCKEVYYKVGQKGFVNGIYPTDTYSEGVEPLTLGGYEVSPEVTQAVLAKPEQSAEQQQADAPAGQEAPPAQASNETTDDDMDGGFEPPDDDDPFGALDGEDFDDNDFPGLR
jgi:hypothetical protein